VGVQHRHLDWTLIEHKGCLEKWFREVYGPTAWGVI